MVAMAILIALVALVVQSLCGHTPNPVQYLDFGDNISLLGMLNARVNLDHFA